LNKYSHKVNVATLIIPNLILGKGFNSPFLNKSRAASGPRIPSLWYWYVLQEKEALRHQPLT
jgi:hypothetical protein